MKVIGVCYQEADRLSDDDLFKLLADARKPGGKMSRLKTFTADLALQLSGQFIFNRGRCFRCFADYYYFSTPFAYANF